jgi:signal transduction histidine kinase
MDIAGAVDGPATESLGFLLDGARRMQDLVDDLLAFSRIGNTRESVESCDCAELARRACEALEARIEESGAEIETGELPTVTGDAGQLTQVFVNLIGNAIRFRGNRAPRIRVSAERIDGHWQIAIRDNGIGIAADDLDRIFEIFNRLHPERGGTGIGLALCKRIVERHGGQIWAESEVGVGSTFYVSLPVSESEEAARTVVRFEKGSRRRAE